MEVEKEEVRKYLPSGESDDNSCERELHFG